MSHLSFLPAQLQATIAGLSLTGSTGIIVSYLVIKELRKHPTSLVFFLSICDFFFTLKYFLVLIMPGIPVNDVGNTWCTVSAFWSQFFGLASISWTSMICVNLITTLNNPFADTSPREKFYHVYVWIVSLSTAIVLAATGLYQSSGDGTCWLNGSSYLGWLFFHDFLILYELVAISTLIFASLRTKNLAKATDYKRRVLIRMAFYVVIFILSWLGPLSNKIYQFYTEVANGEGTYQIFFETVDRLCVYTQGGANAFVWFTNPSIFLLIKSKAVEILSKCPAWCPFSVKLEETLKLIPGQQYLEDKRADINRIPLVLRKNMLTSILLAIRKSLSSLQTEEGFTENAEYATSSQKKYKSAHYFTELDLEVEKKCQEVRQFQFQTQPPPANGNSPILSPAHTTSVDIGSSSHLDFPKSDATTSVEMFTSEEFTFYDLSPKAFQRIRQLSGIADHDYMRLLHPRTFLKNVDNEKALGGRSGSFFCFSPDKKLIVKTIPKSESTQLFEIMYHYLMHLEKHPRSLLVRFYGSYMIKMPHGDALYIVVMQNVFDTQFPATETYDLKGSWIDRGGDNLADDDDQNEKNHDAKGYEEESTKPTSIFGKDLDLVQKINIGPMYKRQLMNVLTSDADFLRSLEIMDYSLLLGIHKALQKSPTIKSMSTTTTTTATTLSPPTAQNASMEMGEIIEQVSPQKSGKYTKNRKKLLSEIVILDDDDGNSSYSDNVPKVSVIHSVDGTKVYLFGLIDILQAWNFSKKSERFVKVFGKCLDGDGISAADPNTYCTRFLTALDERME